MSNVNNDVLVEGFEAYEAMMDRKTYASDTGTETSMDKIMDAYNESREEACY